MFYFFFFFKKQKVIDFEKKNSWPKVCDIIFLFSLKNRVGRARRPANYLGLALIKKHCNLSLSINPC